MQRQYPSIHDGEEGPLLPIKKVPAKQGLREAEAWLGKHGSRRKQELRRIRDHSANVCHAWDLDPSIDPNDPALKNLLDNKTTKQDLDRVLGSLTD